MAELTSSSCVFWSNSVSLVVAVGSNETLSRPTRTNNFASDSYSRGQTNIAIQAKKMDSRTEPRIKYL